MKLVQTLILGVIVATATANQCICDEGKYLVEASYTCGVPTTKVENCAIYQADQSCIACNAKFQRTTEGKCEAVTTPIPNCKFTIKGSSGPSCVDCNKGFYKKEGKCVANPASPANCKTYKWDDAKVQCDECNDGYYANGSDGSCVKNPSSDANCAQWKDSSDCNRCKDTHFMDKNVNPKKCTVLPSDFTAIAGCKNYEKSKGETKIKCKDCITFEYGKKDDSCKKCPYVYGSSGADYLSVFALLLGVVLALLF